MPSVRPPPSAPSLAPSAQPSAAPLPVAARTVHAIKRYGGSTTAVVALNDVTVDFAQGCYTAVMGPTGAVAGACVILVVVVTAAFAQSLARRPTTASLGLGAA